MQTTLFSHSGQSSPQSAGAGSVWRKTAIHTAVEAMRPAMKMGRRMFMLIATYIDGLLSDVSGQSRPFEGHEPNSRESLSVEKIYALFHHTLGLAAS